MIEPYTYDLPKERIAQFHASTRGARSDSRLLVAIGEGRCVLRDARVAGLREFLRDGDLLILNNTKVKPSRFFLELDGGKEGEILLVSENGAEDEFVALARPVRSIEFGREYRLSPSLDVVVLGRTETGSEVRVRVQKRNRETGESVYKLIEREALMPIPPYIRAGHAEESDREHYQTVYASALGSIAAPTAGLHFTTDLLKELSHSGIESAFVTLHVGVGSFRAARQQDAALSRMEPESYFIAEEVLSRIRRQKREGGRVVVVGTTSMRALESEFLSLEMKSELVSCSPTGWRSSQLMITPGFAFRVADLLFTNFHQPGSTHLLLVEAFIGRERLESVYSHALSGDYSFLSYGDAMLLERSAA